MSTGRERRLRPTRVAALVLLGLFIAEILVIRAVAGLIGGGPTFLLLVATSVLGAWCIAHEGRRTWRALGDAVRAGRPPERELADSVLVVVGGLLLLLPGFVSDVLGLVLVLPFTRVLVRGLVTPFIGRHLLVTGQRGAGRSPVDRGQASAAGTEVIEGEIIDDDPDQR